MVLRWWFWYVEDLVTLNMLLRWRCSYVEDVVTLIVLIRWRCCYVEHVVTLKMLLRWKCWKCFQNGIVDVKSKKPHVHFAHGSLVDYCIFMFPKNTSNLNNTQFHWFLRRQHKMKNLKNLKKNSNGGQHIPGMLSACWTDSICYQIMERTQNTVKHSEKWHFSKLQTMNLNCVPGNLKPLPNIYRYIYIHTHDRLKTWCLFSAPRDAKWSCNGRENHCGRLEIHYWKATKTCFVNPRIGVFYVGKTLCHVYHPFSWEW